MVDPGARELRLQIDPSVNRLLPAKDEARRFYDRSRRIFGSDEQLVVAIASDDLFSSESLRRVKRLGSRLAELDGVERVLSLFTALRFHGAEEDLAIEPFITEIPEDREGIESILRSVLEDPIYGGNLVSRDGRATALLVYLEDMPEAEFIKSGLDARIAELAAQEAGEAEVWIGGVPHVKMATSQVLLSDLMRVVPLGFALLAIVAALAFRTARGVIVPLTTILIANTWTLATMASLGYALNLVTIVVPVLVQTIGFAYAIHVVSAYYELRRTGRESGDAAADALRHIALSLLLTGVTTAAGLFSLTLSPMTAVREFGVASVFGVLYTMVAAATFAPADLQLGNPAIPSNSHSEAFDEIAGRLARFDQRHRRAIFVGAGLALAIALAGMTRIQVNTDFVTNFAPEHPVRRDYESINASLEGAGSFSIVLQTDYAGAFKEPVNLREIEALQRWLEAQPEMGATTSPVSTPRPGALRTSSRPPSAHCARSGAR